MAVVTALIVLLAPLMLLVAIAILLESGRPVLFAQARLGQHGIPFQMLKFRKFRKNAGTAGLPLTCVADPRMTQVGRILCATKLDELPQLFNVLAGDMALVGPRPESMRFADCLCGEFRRVLAYKPGLFGPTQVLFRDESRLFCGHDDPVSYYRDVLLPAKARIDLGYYEARSRRGDLLWIAGGVLATLRVGYVLRHLWAAQAEPMMVMTALTGGDAP